MQTKTNNLFKKAMQLVSISEGQRCHDCMLMKDYMGIQYHYFREEAASIDRLSRTNSKVVNAHGLTSFKQTVAMMGLYTEV